MSEKNEVYVVTRCARRVEEANYSTKSGARDRADALVKMLKKWKDSDFKKVSIVKTSEPRKIR